MWLTPRILLPASFASFLGKPDGHSTTYVPWSPSSPSLSGLSRRPCGGLCGPPGNHRQHRNWVGGPAVYTALSTPAEHLSRLRTQLRGILFTISCPWSCPWGPIAGTVSFPWDVWGRHLQGCWLQVESVVVPSLKELARGWRKDA